MFRKIISLLEECDQKPIASNFTGSEVALKILKNNKLDEVDVIIQKSNEDNGGGAFIFNEFRKPDDEFRNQRIELEEKYYHKSSVASAMLAAHECGHAYQLQYQPVRWMFQFMRICHPGFHIAFVFLIFLSILISEDEYVALTPAYFLGSILLIYHTVILIMEAHASYFGLAQLKSLNLISWEEGEFAKLFAYVAWGSYFMVFTSIYFLVGVTLGASK